ncbi:MAG TPA: hypothetical protein VFH43_06585 [Candidatus Kapabacteria bacterium]|nr:hypothetical protein [Candidatus Kapabacteria bacterium]
MRTLPYRWIVVPLLVFIAIGAIPAGYGFLGTPDGSAVGIPAGWIEDTPFSDYLIPGALLMGLGVLHLAAAYLELRRDALAPWLTEVAGCGMIIWIAVQAIMMGSFRHPIQTTLQAVCITVGITTAILGYLQIRRMRSAY